MTSRILAWTRVMILWVIVGSAFATSPTSIVADINIAGITANIVEAMNVQIMLVIAQIAITHTDLGLIPGKALPIIK